LARPARKTSVLDPFSRTIWRALGQGLVFLLLLTHQAWAGLACPCKHPSASSPQCHQAAAQPDTAARHQGRASQPSSHCSEAEAPAPDAEPDTAQEGAQLCCHSLSQANEVQAVSVSPPNPVPVEHTLPSVSLSAPSIAAPERLSAPRPPRSRPLYLALSCLLI
jgi:hypothetical protein